MSSLPIQDDLSSQFLAGFCRVFDTLVLGSAAVHKHCRSAALGLNKLKSTRINNQSDQRSSIRSCAGFPCVGEGEGL